MHSYIYWTRDLLKFVASNIEFSVNIKFVFLERGKKETRIRRNPLMKEKIKRYIFLSFKIYKS